MRWRAPCAFLISMMLAASCAVGRDITLPARDAERLAAARGVRRLAPAVLRLVAHQPGHAAAGRADTARVPFAYDTTSPRPRGDSTAALRWIDLIQDSVLRPSWTRACGITATCAPRSP